MPTENLLEFVLYFLPGFLAIEVYRCRYPARERKDVVFLAWSVFWGVTIYHTICWLDRHWFKLFLKTATPNQPRLAFLVALFFAGIIVGIALIILHWFRSRFIPRGSRLAFLRPDPQTTWADINRDPSVKDWVVVFLDDGSIYRGWISKYRANPNLEDQDFLLSDAVRVDEGLQEKYRVDGKGVYLHTRNVKRIEFLQGGS